jgi:hypothetical protein
MGSDEESDDRVAASDADRSVALGYPHTPKRQCRVQRFELLARVRRVRLETTIRLPGSTLDVARQPGEIATERWMKARDHS